LNALLSKGLNHSIASFYVGAYFGNAPQKIFGALQSLVGLVTEGTLVPFVELQLPLEQAAEAQHLLESRQTTGKVVLHPWA